MRFSGRLVLGLDLGTTSISLVVVNLQDGSNHFVESTPHNAALPPDVRGASIQNPAVLLQKADKLVTDLCKQYPEIDAIGITGQMHGILPIDSDGLAVGPAYTWLDGRAAVFSDQMQNELGAIVPVGYGAGTLYALSRSGTLTPNATAIADIPAWISARLTRNATVTTGRGLAHSIGFFLSTEGEFDSKRWNMIADITLPQVGKDATFVGKTASGVPVCVPEGDNQASFLASVADPERAISFNIGTSGQVSLVQPANTINTRHPVLDARPFPGGKMLFVGTSLSGGKSFDLLAEIVNEIAKRADGGAIDPFAALNSLERPRHPLSVDTRFAGTRGNPAIRGSIMGIGLDNFTLSHLYWGFATGVIDELIEMLGSFVSVLEPTESYIAISGNALERSVALRTILADRLGRPLRWPDQSEAAARGAAILAAAALNGGTDCLPELQSRMINYRNNARAPTLRRRLKETRETCLE